MNQDFNMHLKRPLQVRPNKALSLRELLHRFFFCFFSFNLLFTEAKKNKIIHLLSHIHQRAQIRRDSEINFHGVMTFTVLSLSPQTGNIQTPLR